MAILHSAAVRSAFSRLLCCSRRLASSRMVRPPICSISRWRWRWMWLLQTVKIRRDLARPSLQQVVAALHGSYMETSIPWCGDFRTYMYFNWLCLLAINATGFCPIGKRETILSWNESLGNLGVLRHERRSECSTIASHGIFLVSKYLLLCLDLFFSIYYLILVYQ